MDITDVQMYARAERDQRRRNVSRYPCKYSTCMGVELAQQLENSRRVQMPDATRSEWMRTLIVLGLAAVDSVQNV